MPSAETAPSLRETVLLGLLHGPAELLPVSSSAHVALIPRLLGWRHVELDAAARKEVEVALHAGTLCALLPGWRPRDPALLALATLPPALAGLLFEGPIERRFGTPRTLALGLAAGAVALAWADRSGPKRSRRGPSPADALALGAAQAAALLPGVSRHGAALAAARSRGFDRPAAHALSRDAAMPVLAGATVLKGARVVRRPESLGALAAGAAASAASTLAARRLLRAGADERPLWPFAAYRLGLAALALGTVPAMARETKPVAGRVVAVTGGARGIGRAIAAELARRGAKVAIGDVDAGAAQATAGELGVLGLPLDVTDRGSFAGFLDEVEARLGAVDVIVNNAGIAPLRPFADEDDAVTRRQLDINLFGVIIGTKLALERMLPRGRGHVVNVASSAGRFAAAGLVTYSATKHGVVGLTEAARQELRGRGIDFSIVFPGVVDTEMIAGTRKSKLVKVIQPQDVANAVADAVAKPRLHVWVPREYDLLYRFTALLSVRAREGLMRALGADRMYRHDQLDQSARAGYEARA